MGRSPTIHTNQFPYHVTARCNNKDWYKVPLSEVWEVYKHCWREVIEGYNFEPLLFVLMNNHFHCILSTPDSNISKGMAKFMRQSSLMIGAKCNRINKLYGGRYKASVITKETYFCAAYKYVVQNPVRAGLLSNVEKYPWSSLNDNNFPSVKDHQFIEMLPTDRKLRVEWLNSKTTTSKNEAIRKALRRTEFKPPRSSTGFNDLLVDY